MGVSHQPDKMGVKINIVLMLSLASLAAATSPKEDNSEARVLFSNYTSGLLALMPINSTTYDLATLVIAGGALLLVAGYLLTSSGDLGLGNLSTENSHYYNQYRAFNTEFKKMTEGVDLMSLVSSAVEIYSKLNENDDE